MDQTLYIKYNSRRKPEFRVVTEIREKNGVRRVLKRAGCSAALPQIDRLEKNRDLLSGLYREIRILPPNREQDALVFPYVEGASLKSKIGTDRFDKDRFVEQVNSLLDRVLDFQPGRVQPFHTTPEFIECFGDCEIPELASVCPANIDSLLDHFIENLEGLWCLDYEWVCPFPVPVDFIRFRTVDGLYNEWRNSFLEGIPEDEFLSWFGLDEEEQNLFQLMENRFQESVLGTGRAYNYLPNYLKENRSLPVLLEQERRQDLLLKRKDEQIAALEEQYQEISRAFFWRITKPIRSLLTGVRSIGQGHRET